MTYRTKYTITFVSGILFMLVTCIGIIAPFCYEVLHLPTILICIVGFFYSWNLF